MIPQLNEDTAKVNVQSENDIVINLSHPTVQSSSNSSPSLMIPQLDGETTLDTVQDENKVVICGDAEKRNLIQRSPKTTTKAAHENIPPVHA